MFYTGVAKLANMVMCSSWLQEAACKPRIANTAAAGKYCNCSQNTSSQTQFLTACEQQVSYHFQGVTGTKH
jgi:hypothetical protein